MPKVQLRREDYTIGWICALPCELEAAKAMLDVLHSPLQNLPRDRNDYTYGSMHGHNVVIVCLPPGRQGAIVAAGVACDLLRSFKLRAGLMVGIGGGVPKQNIHLGDVVISKPDGQLGGIVQYDLGKSISNGNFQRTGSLPCPPRNLLTALTALEANDEMYGSQLYRDVERLGQAHPSMKKAYASPELLKDILFAAEDVHLGGKNCDACRSRFKPLRQMPAGRPRVHYGLIGSGSQAMRDAKKRDQINSSLGGGVLCFETEAAGVMNELPCVVIRGICSYSDSHKNEAWQEYAAAVAAAEAKELLRFLGIAEGWGMSFS